MDLATLDRLAATGFSDVSPETFRDLWRWCRDWCEATGDGRYCSLADLFRAIDRWWDEYGVVSTPVVAEIERTLMQGLPDVLATPSPVEGAHFARLLRQQVLPLLTPPEQWPR